MKQESTQESMDPDQVELRAIDKASEREEQRFNFSMFFIMGTVLWLIGFFRMLVFEEIDLLNIGFVVVGLSISLGSQAWLHNRKMSAAEKRLVEDLKEDQYEIQAADFGFTEQIHQNKKHQEYRDWADAQKADPDIDPNEKKVDTSTQASYDEQRKLEDD